MIMGLIREANHEVNGSLATYQIDDLSNGSIEVKWWHDVNSSLSLSLFLHRNELLVFVGFKWIAIELNLCQSCRSSQGFLGQNAYRCTSYS